MVRENFKNGEEEPGLASNRRASARLPSTRPRYNNAPPARGDAPSLQVAKVCLDFASDDVIQNLKRAGSVLVSYPLQLDVEAILHYHTSELFDVDRDRGHLGICSTVL
ncbi:hypothetical protein M758_9G026900 [Ceratodon purpureus]|nr:hypothetical protein M758_9G026900 [Ceratodon purpureus]